MSDLNQELQRTEGYLAVDPLNPHLLAKAIDLCLACADAVRANGHVQSALQAFPGDPFFQARSGGVYLAMHDWQAAADCFDTLLAQHAEVHLALNLGLACVRMQQFERAVDALLPFVGKEGTDAGALTLLVQAAHHCGQLDLIHDLALAYEQVHAAHAPFLAACSLALFDRGDEVLARRLANAALAAQGARPIEALVARASFALDDIDADMATALFEEALAISPRDGRSWSGLGMASLLRNEGARANEQLALAVQYMPSHIGTWLTLGWSKLVGGDLAGARAAIEQALLLDRNFAESHGALAALEAKSGNRSAAEAEIALALRLDPQSLSPRYAQMLLAGETSDPAQFQRMALRLLASNDSKQADTVRRVLAKHA